MTNALAQVINYRYQIQDSIGQGGMGIVYRALDRLNGTLIALKRVHHGLSTGALLSTGAGQDFRLIMANEFRWLASLRHPNIISVLDYGFDVEQQPFYTMELLESASTIIEAGRNLTLQARVALLAQMFQALHYLHHRGIVHHDLKPSNVLVQGEHVKVLDFGLSVALDSAVEATGTAGTLSYMAPELFSGGRPNPASDLYSAGLMAFEVFTGRYPFELERVSNLIAQITQQGVQFTGIDLPPAILDILKRLVERDPEARYRDARAVLADLNAVTGSLPLETQATRESFIQASRFIGREHEMAAFSQGLENMLKGNGGAWLIGGESGVGKTRLVSELQTQALVRGVQVLRGQASIQAAYKVWRPVFRALLLSETPTAQERGVLLETVPNLIVAGVAIQPAAEVPALDPAAAQTRLFITVEALLARNPQPTLIILEDLHWAGTESVALLEWLARQARHMPMMLVGTFRDDEFGDLPSLVPDAEFIRLNRFSAEQIATLSRSILGEAGDEPELLRLLQRETEGNALFLVETVRTLAEEAGHLGLVGAAPLPTRVAAGGIDRILSRRLDALPSPYYRLLEKAAVAGRQVNYDLIAPDQAGISLDEWARTCASLAIMEPQETTWRFTHERLRENVLSTMTPERRREAHRDVALALERTSRSLDDDAATLAQHWQVAGDAAKELRYTVMAGERALAVGAHKEAVTFFERALALGGKQGAASFDEAHWLRATGEAYHRMGENEQSYTFLRRSLAALGFPEPAGRRGILRGLLRGLARQIARRARDAQPNWNLTSADDVRFIEAARAYRELAELYYFTEDAIMAIHATVSGLNIAEQVRPSAELAQCYADMVVACGLLRQHRLAASYRKLALSVANWLENEVIVVHVNQRISLYQIGSGNWQAAHTEFSQAISRYEGIGDRLARARSMSALCMCEYALGNLQTSRDLAQGYYQDAIYRDDLLHQSWGLAALTMNSVHLGNVAEARRYGENGLALLNRVPNRVVEIRLCGSLALAHLQAGETTQAAHYAERGLRVAAVVFPSVYSASEGVLSICRAYLDLYQRAAPAARAQFIPAVQAALQMARKYRRRFSFVQAGCHRIEGLWACLQGRHDQARKSWLRGLERARRFGMPFEEAQILSLMGRHLPTDGEDRHARLKAAQETFARIGAAYELHQVETLLQQGIAS